MFLELLKNKNISYKPLDIYVNNRTKIRFQCDKNQSHIWYSTPSNILNGRGCPICNGKQVFVGFTDMWTTSSENAKFLLNPNDGYKYTKCSSKKKVKWICPDCGYILKGLLVIYIQVDLSVQDVQMG